MQLYATFCARQRFCTYINPFSGTETRTQPQQLVAGPGKTVAGKHRQVGRLKLRVRGRGTGTACHLSRQTRTR